MFKLNKITKEYRFSKDNRMVQWLTSQYRLLDSTLEGGHNLMDRWYSEDISTYTQRNTATQMILLLSKQIKNFLEQEINSDFGITIYYYYKNWTSYMKIRVNKRFELLNIATYNQILNWKWNGIYFCTWSKTYICKRYVF